MYFSFWFDTINLGWSKAQCGYKYIEGSLVITYKKYCIFSLKIVFVLDPDEILHYAEFHLGLHYLSKYMFRSQ